MNAAQDRFWPMWQNDVPTIVTHDREFRRFDGIEVRDPFA